MWEKDPTVTHQPARGQRYYRAWPAVLPQGRVVLLLATKRYYRTAVRYYRTDPRYCRNPSVGVKTGESRVGGSRTVRLGRMVTGDKGHDVFYPGSGPLDGGKTLLLLD